MLVKLKANIPEIFLGALLTVGVFALGMVFDSQRHLANQPASAITKQIEQKNDQIPFSWNWLTHDGTVFFTFVLAFIAGIQAYFFLRQLSYMKDGIRDARIAANAADLNARAVIALQLPMIGMQPTGLSWGDHIDGENRIETCAVHFIEIVNHGKSKAIPKEVLYAWTVGDALPAIPSYRFTDRFPLNSTVEPDAAAPTRKFLTFDCTLQQGDWNKICKGNYLWFYADLIFEDFMGETRHQSSCWRWAYTGNGVGWRIDETPAYNRKT